MNKNDENQAPMWKIQVRDKSGRWWSTYYEGGDKESVKAAFQSLMPLTIDADVMIGEAS